MPTSGTSLPHDAAHLHVRGAAPFLPDLPPLAGELCVIPVGSPVAHGRILRLNVEAARKASGVAGVWTSKDIPGHNYFGAIAKDEPFLAEEELLYIGQPVAVIAAETPDAARKAAALVDLEVEEREAVLDIRTAIAREQFLGEPLRMARGDFATAWALATRRLEGEVEIGGQEQFYLESQICLTTPLEDGQFHVHSSTQNPTEIQHVVAEMLGRSMHDVVCECRRMGGGFGGKETQAALPALMTALVAAKTGRPARAAFTKDDDMRWTGKRHAYLVRYWVAIDAEGRVEAIRLHYFSNAGATTDLSPSVLERSLLHADNAYYFPAMEAVGRLCKTNLPSNTAFRGFGGPQGVAGVEAVLEEVARHLGVDSLDVRRRNCYGIGERNVTHYGQTVENNTLPELFERLEASSDYRRRRAEVRAFNACSRTHVKGLALTPVKFGLSFTARFLNQGNALVNVYTDGTVQVSTGATEMGQGTNTKIRQLVADEFGLPPTRVRMMSTTTEKNINTSPTAASASTDLNGFAALDACRQIKERMTAFAAERLNARPERVRFADGKVFAEGNPEGGLDFGEFCALCRLNRVDLGARGFYATPGLTFDKATCQGRAFHYYTNGAAVAEVTVDRFTGQMRVDRVDLLMDLGRMINPSIDRGQVIGGFVQGMGWVTTEQLVYSERGALLSHSPTTYKIPGIDDVPEVFNVAFLENESNVGNVYRSKAVGEPPLLLGLCVWAAARDVVRAVTPAEAPLTLRLPATGEELLRCLEAGVAAAPASASSHGRNGKASTAPVSGVTVGT